jgi:glucose-6-phosphate 1-epimerase
MPATIESLQFHGLPALRLTTPAGASAVVSLFGAQVLSWIPAGGQECLYLSPNAVYDGSVAIRGGIPVCFPQFAGLGSLPKHGLVRTRNWTVAEERPGDDFAMVILQLSDDDETRSIWPQSFAAELTVAIDGTRLDVELEVENSGYSPFAFTAALHTYLRVREVETAQLQGLHGHEYRDAADKNHIKQETGDVLTIDRETDRVYHDAKRPLLLRDGPRNLGIQAEGFPDVVVWNPWEERCAELPDMPANGFRHMLCVEAAAAHHRIELAAGESWFGRQTLVVL